MLEKKYTKEVVDMVVKLLERHKGNYGKVISASQLPSTVIEEIDIVHNMKYGYTKEGKGPRNMQKYLVSTRHVYDVEGWTNKKAVVEAKKKYNKGLVETAVGRDGMNLLFYAIPRKVPAVNRKPWFEFNTNNVVTLHA